MAGDLLAFQEHPDGRPAAILCMGDILTHLGTQSEVDDMLTRAAAALPSGGPLILSFRNYSHERSGDPHLLP